MKDTEIKKANLFQALVPIIILIGLLFINITIWGDDSLGGPNQLALTFATAVAGIIAFRLRVSFDKMQHFIVKNIGCDEPVIPDFFKADYIA